MRDLGERPVGDDRDADVGGHRLPARADDHRAVLRREPLQLGEHLQRADHVERGQTRVEHDGDGPLAGVVDGHVEHLCSVSPARRRGVRNSPARSASVLLGSMRPNGGSGSYSMNSCASRAPDSLVSR
ncbi:MAG TPA: hypothetical protein VHF92_06230, partial [Geodermatophilus sp.]|nr:hypothetical protein [Geodermatophilus sp.]